MAKLLDHITFKGTLYRLFADRAKEADKAIKADSADNATNADNAKSVPWSGVQDKPNASDSTDGLMSSTDKVKLDGISEIKSVTASNGSWAEDTEFSEQGYGFKAEVPVLGITEDWCCIAMQTSSNTDDLYPSVETTTDKIYIWATKDVGTIEFKVVVIK